MMLKTTVYDSVGYMTEPEDVFHRLEAEFEDYEAKYLSLALQNAVRARGGVEGMSAEANIPAGALTGIAEMDDAAVREPATKLMEAYRPKDVSASKVA